MLRVFLSVDVELWPVGNAAVHTEATLRHVHGRTDRGDYGIEFQTRLLRERGLVATFYVEPLHSLVLGPSVLEEIVALLQAQGQDIQAHAHPEWLIEAVDPDVRRWAVEDLADLPEEGQAHVLRLVREQLGRVGLGAVCAFRSGNFSASNATLRALAQEGFLVDSSYNESFLGDACQIDGARTLYDLAQVEGLWELPVTCVRDGLNQVRPLQIGAVSFEEMEDALSAAVDLGYRTASVMWHGGELIGRGTAGRDPARLLVVRRLERLLDHLALRPELEVVPVRDVIARPPAPANSASGPIYSRKRSTALRLAEEVASLWV